MICTLSDSKPHDARASKPDFKIGPGEIHIWMVSPDEIDDRALLDCQTLLSEDEERRWRRFHFEKDRRIHLISRALIRTTLSGYTGADPWAMAFCQNKYGKPEIASPDRRRPIRFNLSHTHGLILCGVTLTEDIGADVECPNFRRGKTADIARRFFSPAEARDIDAAPEELRDELFFNYWTLKEALIKAMGGGLSIPLDQFAFELSPKNRPRVLFSHPDDPSGVWTDNEPKDWLFWSLKPSPRHIAAVAVKRKKGLDYRVSMKRWRAHDFSWRL